MNTFITWRVAVFVAAVVMLFANITLWSGLVIVLTMLAIPGLIIWMTGAYLLSYFTLLRRGLMRGATRLHFKLPGKALRRRTRPDYPP